MDVADESILPPRYLARIDSRNRASCADPATRLSRSWVHRLHRCWSEFSLADPQSGQKCLSMV